MIKPLQKIPFLVFLLLISRGAFSQTGTMPDDDAKTKTEDQATDQHNIFKIGANYLNNIVFMGRADTATTPAIVPEVKYTLSNGIFFSGSMYYIPNNKKNKIDGGNLEGGYNFDITDNLSGSASFTKLFYSSTSTQIASSITSTFNGTIDYEFGDIVSASVSLDYDLNRKNISNDFFVSPDISHDFIFKGIFGTEDLLLISPTITANIGTENFYDSYLTNVKKIKGTKANAKANAVIAAYTAQLSKFTLLDYELSAPLDYKVGHVLFQFTPTYAIVKNQLPAGIAAKFSDQPTIFYFEAAVFLKF